MIAGLSVLAAGLVVPFALDGEAASEVGGNGTADAIVSVVSIAGGFVLWRYVFSEKAKAKRREPPDRDRG